jgi:hypothetical protein
MREDQYQKLQDLATKIADVAIHDADPDNWIGAMQPAKDLTREQRGDAYWCRKLAVSSLSVLVRVTSVVGQIQRNANAGTTPVDDGDDDLDGDIAAAEKEATALLKQLTRREAKKDKFVKAISGKK